MSYPSDGDRKRIVTGMCLTYRHDYGLEQPAYDDGLLAEVTYGLTQQQREALYRQMDQLYDHHINPLMRVLTEILGSTQDELLKQRIQQAITESGHG